jgi:hypothetical protein
MAVSSLLGFNKRLERLRQGNIHSFHRGTSSRLSLLCQAILVDLARAAASCGLTATAEPITERVDGGVQAAPVPYVGGIPHIAVIAQLGSNKEPTGESAFWIA